MISSEEKLDEDHISDEEFDDDEEIYGGEEDIDRFISEEIEPHKEEDSKETRFKTLTTLFFAVIGATILGIFSPITAGENANELFWWTPLIGAFIGAIIGAFLGLIVDAFYTATRKDKSKEEKKSTADWSETKL